mgnify:CR=1 FL=1
MNKQENQLYEELRENAIKCNELMDKIYYKRLPPKELKLEYKHLKNSCKNRLSKIKKFEKPYGVQQNVFDTFISSYEEAVIWGFSEPTNGKLERMISALEEASYKFTKNIDQY